jgi:16S rRNA (cytosine967-C5)-methyltransferase
MKSGASAPGAQVRALAAGVVRAVRFDGVSLKAALPPALERLSDARDRALCEAIAFEVARWSLRYECLLEHLLQRALPVAARDVHALLLVGLAQLDAMRLADYAAISSTAEAARVLRQPRHVGLINAVLRRFLRERESLLEEVARNPIAQHAHPSWLIDALRRDWGADADAMLEQNNRAAPMWLRVNSTRISRADYARQLDAAGIGSECSTLSPNALQLQGRHAPTSLPGWSTGLVSVQDLSAQLSAAALDVQPGESVLDACAAPGGKAAHLLECSPELSRLLALDSDPRRLRRVEDTFSRLGLSAETCAGDATAPSTWWDGRAFDRILLDAPCSGTGIIRRQPDIKLHRRATDIAGLTQQQSRLLDALWPLLRAGGRLVYATCSVLKAENEHQIDAFLARTADARALSLPEVFGRVSGAGRQRLAGEDDGDGFFHAAVAKAR